MVCSCILRYDRLEKVLVLYIFMENSHYVWKIYVVMYNVLSLSEDINGPSLFDNSGDNVQKSKGKRTLRFETLYKKTGESERGTVYHHR